MKNFGEIKKDVDYHMYVKHLEKKTFRQSAEWLLCLTIEDIKNKIH